MKKPIVATLLIVVAGLHACTSSTESTQRIAIKPLAIGNKWIGQTTVKNSAGRLLRQWTDTMVITNRVTLGGEDWYLQEDRIPGDTSAMGNIAFTNRTDGLYGAVLTDDHLGFFIPPYMAARYPGVVGDVFDSSILTIETSPDPIGTAFQRVTSIDSFVSCPAGTFKSYRYDLLLHVDSIGGPPIRSGTWSAWAPGVGLVRSEDSFRLLPGEVGSYELLRYELK